MNLENKDYVEALLAVAECRRKIGQEGRKLKRNREAALKQGSRVVESRCKEIQDACDRLEKRSTEMNVGKKQIDRVEKQLEECRKKKEKPEKVRNKLDTLCDAQIKKVESFNAEAQNLTLLLEDIPKHQETHKESLRKVLIYELRFYGNAVKEIEESLKHIKTKEEVPKHVMTKKDY